MSIELNLNENDGEFYEYALASPISYVPFIYAVTLGFDEKSQFPITRNKWTLNRSLTLTDYKTQKVARITGTAFKPMDVNTSGEVNVKASWGDKEGTKISVGGSINLNDDKGNYVKGEIKHEFNREGEMSISAGHKKEVK